MIAVKKKRGLPFMASIFFTLTACSPQPPSDTELTRVFISNELRFSEVGRLCTSRKDIRSVSIEDGKYQVKTELGIGVLTQAEKDLVSGFFNDTATLQMDCLWIYHQGNGQLVDVSFLAYATGLSVSGRSKSIKHIVGNIDDWKRESTKRGELRPLPKENWFIYEPV